MKPIGNIFSSLFVLGGFAALFGLAHAQQASFSSVNVSLKSATDLQTMLEAVESTTPVPFAALSEKQSFGNFWSAQHAPGTDEAWPPLPGDILKLDVWPLGGNHFIIDDRKIDYPALAAKVRSLTAMSALSPLGFSPLVYSPNDLWLEITSVDMINQQAGLLLHNTTDTNYYQLLSKTNLLQPGWTLGTFKHGEYGTNQTAFDGESIGGNPTMFFRAQQAECVLFISTGVDMAVEPRGSDPGKVGNFYLNGYWASGGTDVLTVYYQISGTASNGVDYTLLSGVTAITNSSGGTEIDVQPLADNLLEGFETVTLTLVPTNTYLIWPGSDSATIQIFDSSATVSLEVFADNSAIEPDGPPGAPAIHSSFWVYYSDFRSIYTNLTVNYIISGTASNGVDYAALSGTVYFAPGINAINIDIAPLADNLPEGIETLKLTLLATNTYLVDTNQSTATFFISDSSTTVGVAVGSGSDAVEPYPYSPTPLQTAFFTLSRSDSRNFLTNLTVYYQMSGTASNGVDYATLTGSVTFAPDASSTNIYIRPLSDNLVEGDETVTLTLIHGAGTDGYLLDSNTASAMIVIQDNTNMFAPVFSLSWPIGMDWHAPSNSLIVSYNYNSSGSPNNFARIYTNMFSSNSVVMIETVATNWSGVHGAVDEIKLATVKASVGGFTNGDMYFGNGSGIGWVSADGTRSNMNWCVLTNSTVINAQPLRGSLYVDQTGVFSNQLIVVTSDGGFSSPPKGVWRVDAQAHPTLLTNLNTLHLEGVITLPNNVTNWGPWAGKILTGDEDVNPPVIYAIATNGAVATVDTTTLISGGIRAEDFDIIPPNQNLYVSDPEAGQILKLSANYLTNYVGDLLITEAGENFHTPAKLFIVHWDAAAANFVTHRISYTRANGSAGLFEHVTFAPIDLPTN